MLPSLSRFQDQPSSSQSLRQMEMERFELLTLLSLQQPFFQKNDMIIIQGYPYKASSYSVYYMGLSGLEPPTSRLSGVRSNRLSYKPRLILQKPSCHIITLLYMFSVKVKPLFTVKLLIKSGSHLLSHAVSSIVPSAAQVLTIVFGMGTGVSPERIATKKVEFLMNPHN